MHTLPFSPLVLAFPLLLISCSEDEPGNCDQSYEGAFAIEFRLNDADCEYSGRVIREAELSRDGEVLPLANPDEWELSCSSEQDECTCVGGDEFGRYRVFLTDEKRDLTEVAVLDVTREAPPVCVQTDLVEPFEDPSMGGAGGMSGGDF